MDINMTELFVALHMEALYQIYFAHDMLDVDFAFNFGDIVRQNLEKIAEVLVTGRSR